MPEEIWPIVTGYRTIDNLPEIQEAGLWNASFGVENCDDRSAYGERTVVPILAGTAINPSHLSIAETESSTIIAFEDDGANNERVTKIGTLDPNGITIITEIPAHNPNLATNNGRLRLIARENSNGGLFATWHSDSSLNFQHLNAGSLIPTPLVGSVPQIQVPGGWVYLFTNAQWTPAYASTTQVFAVNANLDQILPDKSATNVQDRHLVSPTLFVDNGLYHLLISEKVGTRHKVREYFSYDLTNFFGGEVPILDESSDSTSNIDFLGASDGAQIRIQDELFLYFVAHNITNKIAVTKRPLLR